MRIFRLTLPPALVGFLPVALVGLHPLGAVAQSEPGSLAPPRYWVGGDLLLGRGLGRFGDLTGGFLGVQASLRAVPVAAGRLHLRLDAGLAMYGEETREVCLPPPVGCDPEAWVTVTNGVFHFGAGPEVDFLGGRAYAFATLGASVFHTTASFYPPPEYLLPVLDREQRDTVLSGRLGGGVRLPLRQGPTPLLLEIGAAYHANGTAEYMRESDVVDHPDGSVTLSTHRTRADLVALHVGVTLGLGRPR